MLLVNIDGPPGAGKTTVATDLVAHLKRRHWNVEQVAEYTKELIHQNDMWTFSDELLVFAEKYRRVKLYENTADVVITDSTLYCSVIYGKDMYGSVGQQFFRRVADKYDSVFFTLTERPAKYINIGRNQDQDQAEIDGAAITAEIRKHKLSRHWEIGHDPVDTIAQIVEEQLRMRGLAPLVK